MFTKSMVSSSMGSSSIIMGSSSSSEMMTISGAGASSGNRTRGGRPAPTLLRADCLVRTIYKILFLDGIRINNFIIE
jgi:hypothetical protein